MSLTRRNPLGMIVFLVGEYGAGTPEYSNRPGDRRERLARQPFVSALAQRLLSHPKGGALAVIGHVDVSWMLTFEQFTEAGPSGERRWKSEGNMTFVNTGQPPRQRGHTVGSAMEFFNTRYTQAAADLVDALLSPTGLSGKTARLARCSKPWTYATTSSSGIEPFACQSRAWCQSNFLVIQVDPKSLAPH